MDYRQERKRLVKWIRQNLTGPGTLDDLIGIDPLSRYTSAILFPVSELGDGIDHGAEIEEDDQSALPSGEDGASGKVIAPVTVRRRYIPPSSVGFSFYATGRDLEFQVQASAAVYEREGNRAIWKKTPLGGDKSAVTFTGPIHKDDPPIDVLIDERFDQVRGRLDVRWREHGSGWIVTVSLFNSIDPPHSKEPHSPRDKRIVNSLFEVSLKCTFEAGTIGDYPRVDYSLLDEEEQELELRYGKKRVYAVGHGAAVDWDDGDGRVKSIWADFIPAVEVPQMTADVSSGSQTALSISRLASMLEDRTEMLEQLEIFVNGYADWAQGQAEISGAFGEPEMAVGARIVARIETTIQRMRRGIRFLAASEKAMLAFALANRAMLDQMLRNDLNQGRSAEPKKYNWRPFQLAFLLTTIESTVKEDDEFRDTVDLIWFPTGGGKTEAYLGLIAFLVFHRRLCFQTSGGGTTVLMRYTLRLLTTQQFVRAARMIFAMELIRRSRTDLGDDPITVGLWAGAALSPNSFEDAASKVAKLIAGDDDARLSLVLTHCPWCAHKLDARLGYKATRQNFAFRCTNQECDYCGDEKSVLPANVVDEALYASPPTLLFSTVDKYARLAWDERPGGFLGQGQSRPPELIVQDELHLLASELGSIAGLYEAALDSVLISKGVCPKYVASTATIRNASEHVRKMYARDLAIFPPSGLDADDSYFAKTVDLKKRPGRLYMGYLAPDLDRAHCMAPLAATLLAASEANFPDDRDELLDAWWTLVVYHGSLRGVGSSKNSFYTDVRDFYVRLESEQTQSSKEAGSTVEEFKRQNPRTGQLTSLMSVAENAETFERLAHSRSSEKCLDAVLATNMISVGLDVSRLATMIINGQPLTTAEYIQASSRVGRADVPGLVFTNFYRDQARSLSHYESFRAYHESFYRFVESGSITPFTWQARKRALHAALVIAIRHSVPAFSANDSASRFDPEEPTLARAIQVLERRLVRPSEDGAKKCREYLHQKAGEDPAKDSRMKLRIKASEAEAKECREHLHQLISAWHEEALRCQSGLRSLCYQESDNRKNSERLLYAHDARIKGLWPTLNSMRQVEMSALVKRL